MGLGIPELTPTQNHPALDTVSGSGRRPHRNHERHWRPVRRCCPKSRSCGIVMGVTQLVACDAGLEALVPSVRS
jgi:hypothetical protein